MSSEQDQSGWQLSQEQFQFIEDTLKDALLQQVDRRVEELQGTQQRLLDEALQHVDDRLGELQGTLRDGEEGDEGVTVLPDFQQMAAEASAEQAEATKRFFLEEIERRLDKSRDAVDERLRPVAGDVGGGSAGKRKSHDRRMLIGMAGVLALLGVLGFFAVGVQVGRVLDDRATEFAELRGSADETLASLAARSQEADSIGRALASDAEAIRGIASAEGLRTSIIADLTADPGFISRVTGPRGPGGPPGAAPENIAYGPGRFTFSNPSGVSVATIGADVRGEGLARVASSSGQTEISLQAAADSSSVVVDGGRGARAYVGTLGGTQARVQVSNATGDGGVTIRSEGGLGAVLVNGRSIADFAEVFELATRDKVEPGTVMSVADDRGRLAPSTHSYDPRAVGIVSGAGGLHPGMVLGTREDGTTDLPIAISGQVYVRVSNEGGPIGIGDLLVPSSEPGVAMAVHDPGRAMGSVIGKALEPLRAGGSSRFGLIRALVMVR